MYNWVRIRLDHDFWESFHWTVLKIYVPKQAKVPTRNQNFIIIHSIRGAYETIKLHKTVCVPDTLVSAAKKKNINNIDIYLSR